MEAAVLEKTGYCGIYCGDCVSARSELFCVARTLKSELVNTHLDTFSKLKDSKDVAFKDYNRFLDVLSAIINLECSGSCRSGGCDASCEVRACANSKLLVGCWECENREDCPKLEKLKKQHPNLDFHLNIIANEGLQAFHNKRKPHYQ